jgi:hypothetical protein
MPTPSQTPLDVALVPSPTTEGRLTFQWDASGDLVFDDSQAYSVLVTVVARKGQYRFDRTLGTLLYTVTQDRRSTSSQLAAYAADGGAQAAGQGASGQPLIRNFRAAPTRTRLGAWRLPLSWQVNGSEDISRTLGF